MNHEINNIEQILLSGEPFVPTMTLIDTRELIEKGFNSGKFDQKDIEVAARFNDYLQDAQSALDDSNTGDGDSLRVLEMIYSRMEQNDGQEKLSFEQVLAGTKNVMEAIASGKAPNTKDLEVAKQFFSGPMPKNSEDYERKLISEDGD